MLSVSADEDVPAVCVCLCVSGSEIPPLLNTKYDVIGPLRTERLRKKERGVIVIKIVSAIPWLDF